MNTHTPLTLNTFISPSVKFGGWVGDPYLLNQSIMSTFRQWHVQTLKSPIRSLETHLVSIHIPYMYILPPVRFGMGGDPLLLKWTHHPRFSPVTWSNPKIYHQTPRNLYRISTRTLQVYFFSQWGPWWVTHPKIHTSLHHDVSNANSSLPLSRVCQRFQGTSGHPIRLVRKSRDRSKSVTSKKVLIQRF